MCVFVHACMCVCVFCSMFAVFSLTFISFLTNLPPAFPSSPLPVLHCCRIVAFLCLLSSLFCFANHVCCLLCACVVLCYVWFHCLLFLFRVAVFCVAVFCICCGYVLCFSVAVFCVLCVLFSQLCIVCCCLGSCLLL